MKSYEPDNPYKYYKNEFYVTVKYMYTTHHVALELYM